MRYLSRKVRESEWIDDSDAMAACAVIADRMERLSYLDDRQYAAMRAGAMTRRGLGVRRVKAQLHAEGIAEQGRGAAIAPAESAALAAAGIGRASCRGRVCQSAAVSGGAASYKKKKTATQYRTK